MKRNRVIRSVLALTVAALANQIPSQAQVPAIKIGDPAPEIKLEKLLQAPLAADAAATSLKGKVVVLEFWATWCLPCVPAIKHMNMVADKFEDKPVQFIAVTDESDEPLVTRFLREQPIRGWVGLDTDGSVISHILVGAHLGIYERIDSIPISAKVVTAIPLDSERNPTSQALSFQPQRLKSLAAAGAIACFSSNLFPSA